MAQLFLFGFLIIVILTFLDACYPILGYRPVSLKEHFRVSTHQIAACFCFPFCSLRKAFNWTFLVRQVPDVYFWPNFYLATFILGPALVALISYPLINIEKGTLKAIECEASTRIQEGVNVFLWLRVYFFGILPITLSLLYLQDITTDPL